MRRLLAAGMVVVVAFSFIAPLMVVPPACDDLWAGSPALESAIIFPTPLNTSATVPEFPLVSRALMLSGGSTDSALADLNGDNLTDFVVAVSGSRSLALFFRQSDGDLPSSPSLTIGLSRVPIAIAVADVLLTGRQQVLVLEKNNTPSDYSRIEFYDITSEISYELIMDRPAWYASGFLIGNLTGDAYPDLAVALQGNPADVSAGEIQILDGPDFGLALHLQGGRGANSLTALDANSDGSCDLALANFYDSEVTVYLQPFTNFMPPSEVLKISGNPTSVDSGRFDSDLLDDLVISSFNQSLLTGKLSFVYQLQSGFPVSESLSFAVDFSPTRVVAADTDSDGSDDLVLALSTTENLAAALLRKSSAPIWRSPADIRFPTGFGPRAAVFGSFDSTGTLGIAISSARSDWSGSSIAILPDILQQFSNSNGTTWTRDDAKADSICAGDIDNDGMTDFILRYSAANAFGYVRSAGGAGLIDLGYAPSHLIVQDFNGDGFDDILTTASAGNLSKIYFGSSTVPANPLGLMSTGNIIDVSVGDVNHDLLPDIITATDNQALNVFFNRGTLLAPFGMSAEVKLGTVPQALAVGDFSSDGRDDIAYSHSTQVVSILLQKDSEPFISPPADLDLSAAGGADFVEIWSGDFTGDGATDLAGMAPSDPKLYLFDHTGFVSSPHTYGTLDFPENPLYVSVTDVTDDGHADVVATFDSADMLFMYRQSAGGLPPQPSMVFATGAGPNWVTIGDGTGDGRVDLLVNNADSHSISAWEMINSPPTSVAGGPYHGYEGDPIVLSGTALTQISELPITDFNWDFGDGNSSGWTHNPVSSHVYAVQRTYNATLTVRDPFNPSFVNSSVAIVTVADGVPHVSFTWTPSSPLEGQDVHFNDTSTSFDPVVEVDWTIDGVLVSSGLSHSITRQMDDGIHNVTLQVRDADGSINSTQKAITVSRKAPSVAISSPSSASEGTPVLFYAVVDAWHTTGDAITSYEWNFSYTSGPFVPQVFTGTVNQTTHSFQSSAVHANYTVAVQVTDEDGDSAVAFANITIYDVSVVTISVVDSAQLYEYRQVNFTATVDSAFSAVSFEWDFDVLETGFQTDTTTAVGSANHTYPGRGNFLVNVRVHMSNGSYAFGSTYVTVRDLGLSGTANDLIVTREPDQTNIISFDARLFDSRFPDINRTVWDFGDSTGRESASGPSGIVSHTYLANSDYTVTLTLTDGDDNNILVLQKTLKLRAPVIDLRSPDSGSVVRSGTVLRYSISDDSQSLVSVAYSLDGAPYQNFTAQWEIPTAGWTDASHTIIVRAEDPDGNVNRSEVQIIIDDIVPQVTVTSDVTVVYGGSKLNITVSVDDPNLAAGGVLLFVKFPGDKTYSSFPMSMSSAGHYYRVVEVPSRDGTIAYYINATDLASNSGVTAAGFVDVKLHLMDVAFPYLLLAMALLVLGTAAYFLHEARNAVDETFVVYNDGRLISHSTRRLKPGMDDQILGGMLAAIQDFVRESFKDVTTFNIRKLEFGDKSVLIEKGDNLFLAVILHGKASRKIASRMRRIVAEIEDTFADYLTEWDGDLDKVRGVTDIVKKLYSKAPLLAPSLNRRDT